MIHDPMRHHRGSIRLRGYDYAQAGAYFVTICTQDRACLFGEVVDSAMHVTDAGRMVQTVWDELPAFYPGVAIDAFAIMPNHIHGIVVLTGALAGDAQCAESVGADPRVCPVFAGEAGRPRGAAPTGDAGRLSLADIVARFKTMTTKRYVEGVRRAGWPTFPGRLWQRNYYEHVIRDEPELDRLRRYIDENPSHWETDRESPRITSA